MEHRMAPWKRKFLNKRGRLVLIKAVLASIPAYYLSIFKLPSGVARTIEKLQPNSNSKTMLRCGMKIVIGNGNRSSFWDINTGARGCLREACPRIFDLFSRKEGNLAEFGKWQDYNCVWQGVCPPKIEIFLWQLLRGRRSLGPFGRLEIIWCFVTRRLRFIKLPIPSSFVWLGGLSTMGKAIVTLFPICFSTLERVALCLIKLKAEGPSSWTPPHACALKFNVDGSASGAPGNAGIRGVLRNSSGLMLGMFSLYVGSGDSRMAEMLAIHKAISLCAHSIALIGKEIDIVSDSAEAVS
ncbi:hypothetical protein Ddye_008172 [Dipteronia dyeriana]|uniref:RNase H type-1 domain-containing protein n=1 Tax=Dipteronia dyeriana TaxID=168575 RepID=A0AAE0CL25_9ROSI|nr:hypothetical protein Ddye_008172 [Dipteronia dyeriana]